MPVVPMRPASTPEPPKIDPRFLDMAAAMMRKEGKLQSPSASAAPTIAANYDGPRNIPGAPRG